MTYCTLNPNLWGVLVVVIIYYCSLNESQVKVTVYLQRCLASKQCSAPALNSRYLNPNVKLKLIELSIKLYQEF